MTRRQKFTFLTGVAVTLLIIFLVIYFRSKKKAGEKCPDGRNIPSSGDCSDNPIRMDSSGNQIVNPLPQPDINNCVPPSSYITNAFPLVVGMKGSIVKQLQQFLNDSYKSGLAEDGYFGCKTLAALKKALNVESADAEFFKTYILGQGSVPGSTTNPDSVGTYSNT